MQSDLDIINEAINQLTARNEVIERDIKETVSNCACVYVCVYARVFACVRYRKVIYVI